MSILLTILHVIVAIFLVLVVLLQTGKRADLAGAFGGGGSQTAFGTRGAATVLSKATTAAAVIFMLTSLGLSIVSDRRAGRTGTVLEGREIEAPVAPDSDELGLDSGQDTDGVPPVGSEPVSTPVPITPVEGPSGIPIDSGSSSDDDSGSGNSP